MAFTPVPQDYEPATTTFEKYPDGTFKVTGFTWFTTDDKDRPLLVTQKDGKRVGRYRAIMPDGQQGPPASCGLNEIVLLVKGYGGDPAKLPPYPNEADAGAVSNYMTTAEALSKSGKGTEVTVANGWITSTKGADVPQGLYDFKIVDIQPKVNGLPAPTEGQFGGKFAYFICEIVQGSTGDKTWSGAKVSQSIPYAVEVDFSTNPPDLHWEYIKGTQQPTKQAKLFSNLLLFGAPDLFENPNFADWNNILPEVLNSMLKNKVVLRAFRQPKQKGSGLTFNLAALETAVAIPQPQNYVIPAQSNDYDSQARELFKKFVEVIGGPHCFNPGGFVLTEAGVAVAKQYFVPLKVEKIIPHGNIPQFTWDIVKTIVTEVSKKLPEKKDASDSILAELEKLKMPSATETDSGF